MDEALEMARLTLRNQDSRDPAGAKKQVLDAFAELGLKPRDLEAYLGHKSAPIRQDQSFWRITATNNAGIVTDARPGPKRK